MGMSRLQYGFTDVFVTHMMTYQATSLLFVVISQRHIVVLITRMLVEKYHVVQALQPPSHFRSPAHSLAKKQFRVLQ